MMISTWLLTCFHAAQAATVIYTHDENVHLGSSGSASQQTALSRLHCAQLCTRDPSCAAVNYDQDTFECELLTSPVLSVTQQAGSSAMIAHAKVTGQSLNCSRLLCLGLDTQN